MILLNLHFMNINHMSSVLFKKVIHNLNLLVLVSSSIVWNWLFQFPVWIKKVIVSDKFLGCNYKTSIIKWSVKKYDILGKQNSTKLTQCCSIKEQYFFWLCSNLKGGGQKQVRVFTKRAVNWQVESPFKNSFQSVGRFF